MDNTPTESAAVHETVVFLNLFQGSPRPQAPGQGVLSAGGGPASLSARGPRRGGDHRRDSCLWREKAGPAPPLPPVPRRHPHARSSRRHPGRAGRRTGPKLLRSLGRLDRRNTGIPEGVIAIDGKTSRRSGLKTKGKAAIHMVSAFAARQRLVLAQVKVTEKSSEIIAIPKLLDLPTIDGAIVAIDAMGCQREIAQKIIDKKADYILAPKANLGSLREDVELFVAEQKAVGFSDTTVSRHETVDGDRGRIETRAVVVIHDVAWLNQRHDWPGLKAVAVVESTREIDGKTENETRFYISSLTAPATVVGPAIRDHWSIESVPQGHTERSSP